MATATATVSALNILLRNRGAYTFSTNWKMMSRRVLYRKERAMCEQGEGTRARVRGDNLRESAN